MTADTSLPFWDRYLTDPLFAERIDEEARTIPESMHYQIRHAEPLAGPEPCESCGAQVTVLYEHDHRRGGTAWRPGVWENQHAVTRHTPRRCAWVRANPEAAAQ